MEHYLAEQYREGLRAFGQMMPDALQAYNDFTSKCFSQGALSAKQKHLSALAIALYAGNEHCIVYHLEALLDEGASEHEIAEVVAVAGAFGGGATLSHGVILIQEVLEEKKQGLQ
ncbi:carboxymuconolactone decarboxylase family protein [Brevibacillus composti]|uniref:Carboxymuconolactone decarboxylase family protein n=1 Tax=Brevibacillus composti TaxID=2796470 RepID=A0A7T5JMI1_9BACL|nr:carboxymuconolactone decarboxylase family protein [Brevibacillus composti]QQE73005.1 carboxymuconolactone decarboxylase family protein [Brevibacillus composti]QUO40083.1 carboxymuconolactone decarboxylase family protein [Brevibacillus composti]